MKRLVRSRQVHDSETIEAPRKLTLITFAVDFGNEVLSRNLRAALQDETDVEHYEFNVGEHWDSLKKKSRLNIYSCRVRSALTMSPLLDKAKKERRTVLFHGISPALFGYHSLRNLNSFILLDWTRKLYEPILNITLSSNLVTKVHRTVLDQVSGILPFTEAAYQSVIRDYRIHPSKVRKVPMPFNVDSFVVSDSLLPKVRILFVGADFIRKGGDVLLDWYKQRNLSDVSITIVTQSRIEVPAGITLIRNNPGQSLSNVYQTHDILALPTKCDAYPQVIGEAAASGLAVVTTRQALGASEVIREGWNGLIVSSPAQLHLALDNLVGDHPKLAEFKQNSRAHMMQHFTLSCFKQAVLDATAIALKSCHQNVAHVGYDPANGF